MTQFLVLLAFEVAGLALIWFLLRARIRRALEIEGLLGEARREVRTLAMELNETADRNITLLEDRLEALQGLLDEADRRFGAYRRELDTRAAEREVYSRLGRPRPAAPARERPEPASAYAPAPAFGSASAPASGLPPAPRAEELASPESALGGGRLGPPAGGAEEPVRLELGRRLPELRRAEESVIPPRPLREEALDLYRKGFSADIIAVRLGATVAEIELLVSLEEGRTHPGAGAPGGAQAPGDAGTRGGVGTPGGAGKPGPGGPSSGEGS